MTTSPAPDVERVLDRMGRSAFGYRSFPRPDADAGRLREPPAAMPAAPAPSAAAGAAVRFPLIAEALPGPAAAAPPVPPQPAAAPPLPAAVPPPNPFLPRAQAVPPAAASCTSLAAMFRLLSGRAESTRPLAEAARPRDDTGARAPAFPFRQG